MPRLNCWEAMQCQDSGSRCPVRIGEAAKILHGLHEGEGAGRACWAVAGNFCGGEVRGEFALKTGCISCKFYIRVIRESDGKMLSANEIVALLHHVRHEA